jgi:hypothetical protein
MGSPSAWAINALGFFFNSDMLTEQFAKTAFIFSTII